MNEDAKAAMAALNPKERKMVDGFLLTGRKKESTIKAGLQYDHKDKLVDRPEIQRAIQARMDDRSERVDIKADFVLKGIRDTAMRCQKGDPVYAKDGTLKMVQNPDDLEGPLIVQYKQDVPGTLRALELLGKHLKLFTEQHEVRHSGEVHVTQTLEAIGFDGIKALADQKKGAIEGQLADD